MRLMEREGAILKQEASKHESIVQPFLKDAFRQGAHRIRPKYLSQALWFRQIMIGVVYNDIGSTATYEELGDKYGVTLQRILRINKRFLRNLWHNCPPKIQEQYSLEELLSVRKPRSQRSREKRSASGGGRSLAIKAQAEAGVTDINKISKNTGIPVRNIVRAREVLKNWGIDVPRKWVSYKDALRQLKEEIDDKKTQDLLDKLPLHAMLYDIGKKKETSQFLSAANLIRDCGFHPNPKRRDIHFFVDSLRKSGIPLSSKQRVLEGARHQILTYHILLSKDKERAIRVLKEDQSLQRFLKNPVALFCGPEDTKLPNTTKLRKKEDYKAVGRMFRGLGMHWSASNTRFSDIFTPDCPVPIFRMYGEYYYPVAQEEELRSFIAQKLNL